MTALQYAVKAGVVEAARMLCEAGADPDASYHPPLWTPLHSVIWSSNVKQHAAALIRLLVHYGADINKGESNGNSPLFAAISEARHNLVRLLLEVGADIGQRNVAGAGTAVFLVQQARMRMLYEDEMLPIAQTLLAAGVDTTAPTSSGQTAADLARDHGCSAIAALLNAA
jgi:ankyrin repeat protein